MHELVSKWMTKLCIKDLKIFSNLVVCLNFNLCPWISQIHLFYFCPAGIREIYFLMFLLYNYVAGKNPLPSISAESLVLSKEWNYRTACHALPYHVLSIWKCSANYRVVCLGYCSVVLPF